MSLSDKIDWEKGNGLVPAVVQHAITGRVLMLGYMNRESLIQTENNGEVTFFSRTRQTLWTKGETSGNTLLLERIEIDCDHDTLLVFANPQGPTCHLETNSCFDKTIEKHGFGFLGKLESIIQQRLKDNPKDSYTAKLAQQGVKRIAQKVGEESVEVALAATAGNESELICESADLMYHLLLLLHKKHLSIENVVTELAQRQTTRRMKTGKPG